MQNEPVQLSESSEYRAMVAELEADPVFKPGEFWRGLNLKNGDMLNRDGLANFKRTVSQNYYNWFISDTSHPIFRNCFLKWLRRPNLLPFLTRLRDTQGLRLTTSDEPIEVSWLQRQIYRLYVCFVWSIMIDFDHHSLRFKARESEIGNPFRVKYGRRLLTQDLANSIIESNVIADLVQGATRPRIAEVGAGSGRVAHTYLSALPGQYFIFDIPPALNVAQWYLMQTIGRDKVFQFRHFDCIEEVQDEMNLASAVLLTPNQIRKFPDGYFDVMVTISTLPEMRQDQVDLYLSEFQRLSRGHVFIKQFNAWQNPEDGTSLNADSYRFGTDWKITLDRADPIVPFFFNRVWSRTA